MMLLCEKTTCTGCGACAAVCPKACIDMVRDNEGFLYPQIDAERCVECGLCAKTCPVLHVPAVHSEDKAYAVKVREEAVLQTSTSGGLFTLLCRWVFDRGGVVFGAAYRDDFSVAHRAISSEEELAALRFAKYTQSELGDTYQSVRQLLEEGRYVLFSGTPCQVAGLRAFLKKDDEKLVLADVICHGVPSPAVWAHYVRYRSEKDAAGEMPETVNMRSKSTGWPGYSVEFTYANGEKYSELNHKDPFMRGFVRDLYLRPSCHDCRAKGVSRCSDFTLGDYWGVWSQLPEFDDKKGTSLVLVHSKKGQQIWDDVKHEARWREMPLPDCLAENPAALVSLPVPAARETFWTRYTKEDFAALIEELLPPTVQAKPSLWRRVLAKLRSLYV